MHDYFYPDYLQHHGVKGMKWGVRRKYLNTDGSLNEKGVKKYASKGYAEDSYNSNKTKLGKAFDKYTGAHKTHGKMLYEMSSDSQNKERAERYLLDNKKPTVKKIGNAVEAVVDNRREKFEKRKRSYEKTTDVFGVGGTMVRSTAEYATKKAVKGALAKAVNASANAYISANSSDYRKARGADFVRNAAVKGLSVSSQIDQIRMYADMARTAMYVSNKGRS